jgi:hypothetical protein
MREDLEQILAMFQFEMNSERTRREIKRRLESYLTVQMYNDHIRDFKVEDRTLISQFENRDQNFLYFQIYYQGRTPEITVIDITLGGNSVVISDFENNVIGKRSIPKLKL